ARKAGLDRSVAVQHRDEGGGAEEGGGDEEADRGHRCERGLSHRRSGRNLQIIDETLQHQAASICRGRRRRRPPPTIAATGSGDLVFAWNGRPSLLSIV